MTNIEPESRRRIIETALERTQGKRNLEGQLKELQDALDTIDKLGRILNSLKVFVCGDPGEIHRQLEVFRRQTLAQMEKEGEDDPNRQ